MWHKIIDKNIEKVNENIYKAAVKSGRNAKDIKIVAVTKTVTTDLMGYAFEKGLHTFGENRVQELNRKYNQLNETAKWHLIGHLQRNKVKDVIEKVELIHSVDSYRLMKEINKQAFKTDKKIPILIQVNVAEEESKYGIKINEVENFIKEAALYDNLIIKGLMTIAPYQENPNLVRPVFEELKNKYDQIKKTETYNTKFEFLSMGMSNDYMLAIEEGSNMVRIGSAFFGNRNFKRGGAK